MKKPNWLLIFLYVIAITLFLLAVWKNCRAEEVNWDKLIPIIITIESNGDPNAISEDGCIGLMQISPMVLKECNLEGVWKGEINTKGFFVLEDLFNPTINVKIGKWYLKRIWFHYLPYYKLEQNIDNLLWAYNAGIGNVIKEIKPRETRDYIKKYHKLAKGD